MSDQAWEPVKATWELPSETFVAELRELLNRHSAENGGGTPDHILAAYLTSCLAAFDLATKDRDKWYGQDRDKWYGPQSTG